METKPRILYLQKILLERTDEENPLSTTQLINILNDEYGISAHRTTVTKDIAALQEFGMDIVTIHSTQSKYFVASRKFELPELKLLIDAVESSKFITKKKSETLIEKIHTMTSPGQVAKLKRNNYVVNRIKPGMVTYRSRRMLVSLIEPSSLLMDTIICTSPFCKPSSSDVERVSTPTSRMLTTFEGRLALMSSLSGSMVSSISLSVISMVEPSSSKITSPPRSSSSSRIISPLSLMV